jgi:hypothetical protein
LSTNAPVHYEQIDIDTGKRSMRVHGYTMSKHLGNEWPDQRGKMPIVYESTGTLGANIHRL